MLYKGNTKQTDNSSKIIMRMLTEREKKWTEGKKVKMEKRLNEKFKKASNETNLIKKLLADCKSWNGPFTSGEEMITVIKSWHDQKEFIVKTELAFFTHTHKTDKIQRPELLRQNKITHKEKVENLFVLLSEDAEQSSATTANLPTNADVLKVLSCQGGTYTAVISSNGKIEVNRLHAVMWADNNCKYFFFFFF